MKTVSSQFPEYHLKAVVTSNVQDAFVDVSHKSYPGQWKVYFFWPKDFTFVCPTEIKAFNDLYDQFIDRIVDPQGIIRFSMVTDLSVGRNPNEVLRVLDALQTDELCPCNWQKGDAVIKVGDVA